MKDIPEENEDYPSKVKSDNIEVNYLKPSKYLIAYAIMYFISLPTQYYSSIVEYNFGGTIFDFLYLHIAFAFGYFFVFLLFTGLYQIFIKRNNYEVLYQTVIGFFIFIELFTAFRTFF